VFHVQLWANPAIGTNARNTPKQPRIRERFASVEPEQTIVPPIVNFRSGQILHTWKREAYAIFHASTENIDN
jgi:hypothetical protein